MSMFRGKRSFLVMRSRLFSVIRSHGLALHLLSYEDLLSFIDSKDLDQLLDKLRDAEYRKFFKTRGNLFDNREIEARINKLMYERIFYILSLLDEGMVGMVRAYLSKYDIERLRRAIYARKFELEVPKEVFPAEFLPGTYQLLDMKSKRELPSKDLEPIFNALEEWQRSEEKDITLLDMLLERSYAELLRKKLKTRRIDKWTKGLFRKYLNGRLVIVCLRAIYCDESDRISVMQEVMDPETYEILSTAESFEDALSRLTLSKHPRLAKRILEVHRKIKEPLLWEFILFSDLLEEASITARRNFVGAPYIVWYILRTEWEAQAVRLLIIGKKEGVSDETLREILGIASYLTKY
ncbi:MAG TPA: hypothetical protein EYP68_08735 [Candidatus Korarchaeota archaeon]|nr:hypothetical protein [Candidatus Korarchaeota archaeon]